MTSPDSNQPRGAFRAGEVLGGKYLLLAPLGVGGMGQVWTARNLATNAEVAVKVMLPALVTDEGLARFRREAQATATLSHRAIVRVFDLIELNSECGSLALVMELLRGHTLAHEIAHAGPLSVEETLSLASSLLSALSHAHDVGIVHRDLKPENVVLAIEPDGQRLPKIVDFGISKLRSASPITFDGEIVGTFSYMSPEQTMGSPVDERTDIFSIGVLLYECLSGRNPFVSPFIKEKHLNSLMAVFDVEPPPLQNVPAPLWDVIRRAMALKAAERFASAAELAEALSDAVQSSPASSPPPSSAASASFPPIQVAALPAFVLAKAPPRVSRSLVAAAVMAAIAIVAASSAAHTMHAGARGSAPSLAMSVPASHDKREVPSADQLLPVAELISEETPTTGAPGQVKSHAASGRKRLPKKTWFTRGGAKASEDQRESRLSRLGGSVGREPGF